MTNSRAKGARGEREFANYLKDKGFTARRGQQFSGSKDSPDVVCEELSSMIHWEVKRVEALQVYPSVEQAIRDGGEEKYPVVAHRRNGKKWVAILPMDDFIELIKENMERK